MSYRGFLLLVLGVSAVAVAQEPPPLEAYGSLPTVSSVVISPDGELIAYRRTDEERDAVIVVEVEGMRFVGGVDVGRVKPRHLMFVDRENLVLVASDTKRLRRYRGVWEYSSAYLYNIEDDSYIRLLHRAENLIPAQTGLGRIVGRTADGDRIFMPALVVSEERRAVRSLYAVETARKSAIIIADGLTTTKDWFLDADARPFIREDFSNSQNLHQIWRLSEDEDVLLFERESPARSVGPQGLTADRRFLIFEEYSEDSDSFAFFSMSTETGEIEGPIFARENSSVDSVLVDINRVVHGVQYEGFYPTYEFLDAGLTARVSEIQAMLPRAHVRLVSWSDDFERLVVHASGGWTSGVYLLFIEGEDGPRVLARERESIDREHIAETLVVQYQARDGLRIPALVTGYPEVIDAGNAPLILLVHGGPAAFDRAHFDWLAQFFASRGYVVLQPQFRGSTGFGNSHRVAGFGEWGRKMQTDLDDGVSFLADQGVIDPERVCIAGVSYGGYAALAAGAFSPDLYRCHVSINGVSDLRVALEAEEEEHGAGHSLVWAREMQFGAGLDQPEVLDSLSPAHHAEVFQSPVLLLHGRDDTVVPIEQSRRMRSALRRAGKDVEFVMVRGEDHWLSGQETRIEVLTRVAEFIEEHL